MVNRAPTRTGGRSRISSVTRSYRRADLLRGRVKKISSGILLNGKRAPKNPSRRAGIELPGIHDHIAIYDHIRNSARIAVRILKGGLVTDRFGIKQRQIGEISFTNETAQPQIKLCCRHPGHLGDCVFVGKELCVPHVFAEHARKRSIHARMMTTRVRARSLGQAQ